MAGIEPEATLAGTLRAWLLAPVITTLSRLEQKMTDVSQVLNDVADGLSGPLATSIRELIAENASLRGEDAAESAAAGNVKVAFDNVAALFAPADLPNVPDLPPGDPFPSSTDPAPAVVDPNPVDPNA